MNSNTILSSDVLDILFDKRNKNYGAYILRKFYPERVKTSLLIMLGFATLISAFTLVPKAPVGESPIDKEGDVVFTKTVDMPKEIEKPKEQVQQQPAMKAASQIFTNNFEIVKNEEPSTELNNIEDRAIGTVTDTGRAIVAIETPVSGDGPGTVETPATPAAPTEAGPVENPDVPPSYPGGSEALRMFLERNLRSPEDISEAVQVKIKFVVDNDGNLESFAIIQDGGEEFNKEVIRVLKKMPQWNAGKKGGHSVKAYCYLPVKFAPTE